MHIALLSPNWPLAKFQNGIVTYVHWMKQAFELGGHRVSVFTGGVEESDLAPDIYRIPQLGELPRRLRILERLRSPTRRLFTHSQDISKSLLAIHRIDPIDVVEMEESFGWFADVRKVTGIPVVAKLHGPAFLSLVGDEINSEFAREKIKREGAALGVADAIVSPSMDTLSRTLAKYHLAPRLSEHIANPVALPAGSPLWELKGCDRNAILFVGRFDLRKGADVMLDAFALLARERPNLRLAFVGPDSGLLGADGLSVGIASYCATHMSPDIARRVDYRGHLPNQQIYQLRVNAMVTVVASRWESQGYTALEAMAQGCPVVSSDAGALPESVIDRVTGLLATSGSPAAFARQISIALDDPLMAARLGQNARRFVEEKHSPINIATKSLALFERLIVHRDLA